MGKSGGFLEVEGVIQERLIEERRGEDRLAEGIHLRGKVAVGRGVAERQILPASVDASKFTRIQELFETGG